MGNYTKTKENGGLGIGDLVLKNAGLLFKWWWHFLVESAPLWKQVLCSCYDRECTKPLLDQPKRSGGGLWGGIRSIMRIDVDVAGAVCNGICKMVGDGSGTYPLGGSVDW